MQILLTRHGQSKANVDLDVYRNTADHDVALSPLGEEQADGVGLFIANWCAENWPGVKPRIWCSPYRRARQTAERIAVALGENLLDVREHVLLVEQQFGLFDGLDDDACRERYPDEWEHYERCKNFDGRFWARMPLGESRFDVAQRVHQAFGTFHRDADRHGVEHIIPVCHGTAVRAFVMMWCHFSPEWFEAERNPANCAARLLDETNDRGYIFPGYPS